jgi:hypothetical protein
VASEVNYDLWKWYRTAYRAYDPERKELSIDFEIGKRYLRYQAVEIQGVERPKKLGPDGKGGEAWRVDEIWRGPGVLTGFVLAVCCAPIGAMVHCFDQRIGAGVLGGVGFGAVMVGASLVFGTKLVWVKVHQEEGQELQEGSNVAGS